MWGWNATTQSTSNGLLVQQTAGCIIPLPFFLYLCYQIAILSFSMFCFIFSHLASYGLLLFLSCISRHQSSCETGMLRTGPLSLSLSKWDGFVTNRSSLSLSHLCFALGAFTTVGGPACMSHDYNSTEICFLFTHLWSYTLSISLTWISLVLN